MDAVAASPCQPTELVGEGTPASSSQILPLDVPAANGDTESGELTRDATSISTPATDVSRASRFLELPDSIMTPATSQSTEMTVAPENSDSATNLSGEEDSSTIQVEPRTRDDETDSVLPETILGYHVHPPQADRIISRDDHDNAVTHSAQSNQEHENTTRVTEAAPDFSPNQNQTMKSGTAGDLPQEEESLFFTDADDLQLLQLLKEDASHEYLQSESANINQSHAVQSAERNDEMSLSPFLDLTEQYLPQFQHDSNDTEQPHFDPEGAKEAEANTTARRKTGPRARTAKAWHAMKSRNAQQGLSSVTKGKRKRSESDRNIGSSGQKGRKQQKVATSKKIGPSKRDKSLKVMDGIFQSLSSNPIEARIMHGDVPEADPIKATRKGDQLEQIMKSLPQNADERSAARDRRQLDKAARSFGYGNCTAVDGKWLVKGMKSTLHAHQVIGTSWMLGRELGVGGPQGGILADEMGMGKTLQTLACIVSNQPSEDDLKTYCRTTLIVAPATAIDQWESEAKKHVDIKSHTESILHYKRSKKDPCDSFARDVHHIRDRLKKQYQNSPEFYEAKLEEHKGDLLKLNFWRVVLDESHNIKNRNSQMSLACQELNACCRWALSGTPITNSIEEIYPYLKFLKAEVPDEFGKFRSLFMNIKDDVAMQRLTDIVEPIMLRRTMNHTFMGRPLYSIPKPHYDVKYVELTKEERIIYNAVESRFREIINEMLAQKGYIDFSKYLLLFMRLRQAVAHPFMLETTMKNLMTTEDLLNIQRRIREIGDKRPIFQRIAQWCAKEAANIMAGEGDDGSEKGFGRSQFGYKFDMSKQIENALAAQKKHVCRICYQEPVNPQIAACNHAFCRECLLSHIRAEYGGGSMVPKCFECKKPIVDYEPNMPSDEEISDLEGSVSNSSGITIFRGPKLGRDRFKKHPKLLKSSSMFLVQCDQAHPEPVVSSTKTTAVKATILEWKSEAPDDKIIIFVEFKTTAAVLGRMLDAEGIPFLYFFGDMTSTEKHQAIRAFHEKEEITVMIASLKCASVALNITVANRVVLVDLWWNIAVEMQAFGRVFRLGQTKETHFRRIVADLTIDNRLLSLQERKVKDISKIIKSGGKQKLSLEETLSMFGRVKKSESGVLQVLSDEIDSEQDGTEEEGSDYQYESDEDSDN
ncbi:hypothetical protein NPX13_g1368 [Xylaria arbuscula]|uniref:Uncharacterized protein n=1 Tax=Xylaria arbuscula TaxID=114810 RepID=A0A9W8TRD8_9PEZI|nr:hypothetical protein NPX13_g1368 [Xylaria arbuscula]